MWKFLWAAALLLQRDSLDTATAIGNLILTAVGISGVILAYWTLRAIKRQADLMDQSNKTAQTAANTALAQTRAMVDKERARVYVRLPKLLTLNMQGPGGVIGEQQLVLFNVGPTPALNVSVRYSAVATEFEGETISKTDRDAPSIDTIAANHEESTPFLIRMAFASNVARTRFHVHLFGVVEYSDVLSSEKRTTRFRFRVPMQWRLGREGSPMEAWQRFGSPEDNAAN